MVRQWYHYTPDDFIFAAKLVRELTHAFHPKLKLNTLRNYYSRMKGLEDKFQTTVIQFPPHFRQTNDNLIYVKRLLSECRSMFSKNIVVEFRNQSWFSSELEDILRELSIPLIETPFLQLPEQFRQISSKCYYIRLLGDRSLIPDNKLGKLHLNKTAELIKWSEKLINLNPNFQTIFIVINNRFSGYAINDAITIREKLSENKIEAIGFEKSSKYSRGQLGLDDFL